jgi:hypothetical protein
MGFPDEKRNSTVLKGLNGNLDRAVEALIRLGEQNPKSRGTTPTPPAKPGVNGISIDKTPTAPAASASMNPFDALDVVAPLPQQQQHQPAPIQTQQMPYGAPSSQATSPSNPYNPFLAQQSSFQQQNFQQPQPHNPFGQQYQNLEQSFQGLQLSNQQSQQSLFPNRTGGYGQPQPPQYPQTNPFQQSFTPPPMPQMPQQYASFFQPQQTQYQPLSSPTSPNNPFLKSARSQMFTPTNTIGNPFDQVQPQSQPQQLQQQQPQQFQQQQPQQFQQQQPQAPNPFMPQAQTQQTQQQAPNPWQNQQSNYQQSQPTGIQPNQQQVFQTNQQQDFQQNQQLGYRQPSGPVDKSSILALYNYPQLAPQRAEANQTPPTPASQVTPAAPGPGSMNPFAASQGAVPNQQPGAQNPGARHVSNESVDFAGLTGGRHSPDAFSGLSASFRR